MEEKRTLVWEKRRTWRRTRRRKNGRRTASGGSRRWKKLKESGGKGNGEYWLWENGRENRGTEDLRYGGMRGLERGQEWEEREGRI